MESVTVFASCPSDFTAELLDKPNRSATFELAPLTDEVAPVVALVTVKALNTLENATVPAPFRAVVITSATSE